jgi:hypothetical protein
MLQVTPAQIGTRIDCCNSHFPHIPDQPFFADKNLLTLERGPDTTVSEVWLISPDTVNGILNANFFRAWAKQLFGLIINRGTANPQ